MFFDLLNFIKRKIGGVKKAPPVEYNEKKHNKKTLNTPPTKIKTRKQKEKYVGATFFSIFITCIILIYWISLGIDFSTSNEIALYAKIQSYNENLFGVNLEYDIQTGNANYLSFFNVGDIVYLNQDKEICTKEKNCIPMIVENIVDKKVALSFKNNAIPTFFTMKDFNNYLEDSGEGKYGNKLIVHGKLVNDTFIINKISITK